MDGGGFRGVRKTVASLLPRVARDINVFFFGTGVNAGAAEEMVDACLSAPCACLCLPRSGHNPLRRPHTRGEAGVALAARRGATAAAAAAAAAARSASPTASRFGISYRHRGAARAPNDA